MMKRMKFKVCEFHDGVNMTVRRGVEWGLLEVGETFMIVDDKGDFFDQARVVLVRVVDFDDITPAELSAGFHIPSINNRPELLEFLKVCYPAFDFREIVTLVNFVRLHTHDNPAVKS